MANLDANSFLVSRFASVDALVTPDRQDWFESCMRGMAIHPDAEKLLAPELAGSNDDGFWPAATDWRASLRPYIVENGVLKIPVMGVLLNRFGYQFGRYATGYTYIQRAMERGMGDSNVKGIALVCDSPGGEVAGCFELTDKIYGMRGQKPIRAFSADAAYSAAFAIASAANKISMTRSGGVGSVGVVTMHADYSKMLEDFGLKITFIFAGKHKVDGNPYEKLPDNVKARIQKRVDKTYGVFTATVARNRRMDEKDVRATEALTYGSDEALEIGFADKVEVFEDAMAAYADECSLPDPEGPQAMADTTTNTISKEAHDQAVAAARTEGEAAGKKAGATEERQRVSAIVTLPEAANRQAAALEIATTTDLSTEQAKGLLAKLPEHKADAAAPAGAGVPQKIFDAAMGNTDNPNVGAGGDQGDGGEPSAEDHSKRILANYEAVRGKPKQQNGGARQ